MPTFNNNNSFPSGNNINKPQFKHTQPNQEMQFSTKIAISKVHLVLMQEKELCLAINRTLVKLIIASKIKVVFV